MWERGQPSFSLFPITEPLIINQLWDNMETHLRLDRGVYGGVGFSRDLSLRESGESDDCLGCNSASKPDACLSIITDRDSDAASLCNTFF